MINLFTINLSKKERLYLYIKEKEFAKTSEVIKWGTENFSNRADRDARLLAQELKIRRLTDEEKSFRGFRGKEEVWTVI